MYETTFLYNELTRILDEYERAFSNHACENVSDCSKCPLHSGEGYNGQDCYPLILQEIVDELRDKQ